MSNITLNISRADIYNEVAKTTSYQGAKLTDDPEREGYKRIFTTDEDQELLARFWDETRDTLCAALRRLLVSETETETTSGDTSYQLTLAPSTLFDTAQQDSMQRSLRSLFVANIVAKWYTFANKDDVAEYTAAATALLEDLCRKAFYKRKPTRPTNYT